ncbi:MAG: type II secretion system protein [Deltaproteobacteria bacterium]|nr:type II secretion system protein [Deltaproteobacteria bacterium]
MTPFRSRGFTLIELAVVLLILSVAVAVLLPTLPRLTGRERVTAVRKLCLAVQETRDEAVFKKKA